jgi:HEAT repeat protein
MSRRWSWAAAAAVTLVIVVAVVYLGVESTARKRAEQVLSEWQAPGADEKLSCLATGSQSSEIKVDALQGLMERITDLLPVSRGAWLQAMDALHDDSTEVRAKAASLFHFGALVRPPHRQVSLEIPAERLPQLLQAVRDTSPDVRGDIAYVLAQLEHPRALDGIAALAHDSDSTVRACTAEAAGLVSESLQARARELLRNMKTDEDPLVRVVAVESLHKTGENVAGDVPKVAAMLKHSDAHVRRNAAYALGEIGSAEPTGALRQTVLSDPDVHVRMAALSSLGKIGGTAAKEAIEEIVDTPGLPDAVESSAKWLLPLVRLGIIGCDAPKAATFLKHPEAKIRQYAAHVLGNIGSAEHAGALRQTVLSDPDIHVRMQAVNSLGKIGGTPAKKALEEIVDSPGLPDAVESRARWLLGAAGLPRAREVRVFAGPA